MLQEVFLANSPKDQFLLGIIFPEGPIFITAELSCNDFKNQNGHTFNDQKMQSKDYLLKITELAFPATRCPSHRRPLSRHVFLGVLRHSYSRIFEKR